MLPSDLPGLCLTLIIIPTMIRQFLIKDDVFYMSSQFEGDFGVVSLMTSAPLSVHDDLVKESISQILTSGLPVDLPFEQRIAEMAYFLSVFKLFNPQPYEKKSSSESSDLPE